MDTYNIILLAQQLMEQHNLQEWSFELDNSKRRMGLCSHSEKTIYISRILGQQAPEATIKNTLLHEIAHALVGAGHGHDEVWRRKAIEIGCDGERCHSEKIYQGLNYIRYCITCGHFHYLIRNKNKRFACLNCCNSKNNGKFTSDYLLQTKKLQTT